MSFQRETASLFERESRVIKTLEPSKAVVDAGSTSVEGGENMRNPSSSSDDACQLGLHPDSETHRADVPKKN